MANDDRNKSALIRVNPEELGVPARPTDNLDLVREALERAHEKANLLAPLTEIEFIPAGHVMAFRCVLFPIKADGTDGNWYKVDGGKVGLHRSALDMIAQAAGISTVDSQVEITERHVWKCCYTVKFKGFDGQWTQRVSNRILDLRDGAPETEAIRAQAKNPASADTNVRNARKFGPQLAETKARNRAIRSALGIKGAYTVEEARKPFVFPVLIWIPDQSDPEIRRMVAATELGIVEQIYGAKAGAGPLLAAPDSVLDLVADDGADERPAPRPAAKPAPESRQIPEAIDARFAEVPPEPERIVVPKPPAREEPVTKQGPPRECAECSKPLSDRQYDYSMEVHSRPLCWDHQRVPK